VLAVLNGFGAPLTAGATMSELIAKLTCADP
jgi:hypothetical protein